MVPGVSWTYPLTLCNSLLKPKNEKFGLVAHVQRGDHGPWPIQLYYVSSHLLSFTLVYWCIIELWVSIQTPFGNLLAQLQSGSHLWSRVSLGLFFPFFPFFFLSFECTVNQLHHAYITCMEFQHIIVVFPWAHFTGPTYTYLHFFLDCCNHHYFFLRILLTKILGYSSNFLFF
jgi:hypothetical protein